jgi:hypothetical protein
MGAMSSPRSATKWRDEEIVRLLGEVARHRPLDDSDTNLLERTVRRLKPKREVWRWHADEDRKIKDLLARRRRRGPAKPFKRNDEIKLLAIQLGRTEWAVRRRMERLRKKGKRLAQAKEAKQCLR